MVSSRWTSRWRWILVACAFGRAAAGPFRRFGAKRNGWVQRESNEDKVRGGENTNATPPPPSELREETQAVLSMVPVFALTDEDGRPVLMRSAQNETQPQQLFFTNVDVARAHATSIMKMSSDLQLRLATMNLGQVWNIKVDDREIRVLSDPREVHFARQLLLRAAGYANADEDDAPTNATVLDFSNETIVAETAAALQEAMGFDLERDVPLFTAGILNATLGVGGRVVQPWFLSFGDLVRAYVNSTTEATDDESEYQRRAQTALREMLTLGETAVTTVAKLVEAIDRSPTDLEVFIMPPSSSLTVIAQARQQQQQQQSQQDASPSSPTTTQPSSSKTPGGGGGLFDDDDAAPGGLFDS
ncbi:hypothetical protein CTAYLR_009654 [Chrysophaeum taylorii]|uniref:Uncharacterized protein n=1 Tax=Chrysophaeum taylorii TaxID=2483200 RepID=A0AAD7UIW2_9STRA|nr:hypothetical protein CTAYLR_009654 [Chrysophaeum taylorii]